MVCVDGKRAGADAALVLLLLGGLVGCQTAPPAVPVSAPIAVPAPKPGALTPAQVSGLKAMGFTEEAQGWTFNISDSKLLFETGQETLSARGRSLVADIARGLRQLGLERIRVEGHTDNVGSADYNKALSARRAAHVAGQFVQNGMADKDIERTSFGLSKPVADNATPEGRAQNRRVALIVLAE